MFCLKSSLGCKKTPSTAIHSLPVLPEGCPHTSIWPAIGLPKDLPDIARNFLVSTCRNWTFESRFQTSSLQIISQWSPVSPSPDSSPYADISWLPLSGELKWCEWRFFLVERCWKRIVPPHLISDPRGQTLPVGPLTVQCEFTSSLVSTPVTLCCKNLRLQPKFSGDASFSVPGLIQFHISHRGCEAYFCSLRSII